jgi:N-acetylglucosaminyl-diphospho-decaprenol L-rhamnosyltransferase
VLRVDVVVVSYNSSETLRGCVEPLCYVDGATVVVVDNASLDGSLATVSDLPVEAVALTTNLGFGHGCNVGWRRGKSEAVLFLNPDARIDGASVGRLVDVLGEDARAGIVGPRIIDELGSLDYSIRRFPRLSSTYAQAFFVQRLFPRAAWVDEVVRDERRYEASGEVEWISGACMLVRRSLLERLGGFDEGFFLYCEDKDLCRRAWSDGSTVRYEPRAQALHVGGVSAPRGELLPVLAASRIRYARKHAGGWTPAAERLGVAIGSLTHAALGRGGPVVRSGHARAAVAALTSRSSVP